MVEGGDGWLRQLERPDGGFFPAFAARAAAPDGPRDAARDAVRNLTPVVDWAAYLPHVPHGLLGLRAVFRLRPLLAPRPFLRALATQIHAFAHEGRSAEGAGLAAIGAGSGHRGNLALALARQKPSLAWGEALGVDAADPEAFAWLEAQTAGDMANVGHKGVFARDLADLWERLERPRQGGRTLLAMAAWLAASEPRDTFWRDRALRRLADAPAVPQAPAGLSMEALAPLVREVCDCGLVELLDRFCARLRDGLGGGDLLAALVLAAAEKQLDARRDLEGKTAWTFVHLAALARRAQADGALEPATWVQAAALVNLFPTDEPEDRVQPKAPRTSAADQRQGLLDAILDAEPPQAMHLAQALLADQGWEAVLGALAEAATENDPAFNHSHQLLAVAAAADLGPMLPGAVGAALLTALAKSLANSQGSADLCRLAERALDCR